MFHIPICLIKIWTPAGLTDTSEPSDLEATLLTEVSSIEIDNSYKNLISTASVKFPRGTVIRRTITEELSPEIKDIQMSLEDSGTIIVTSSEYQKADLKDRAFNINNRIKIWMGYTTDPKIAKSARISQHRSIFNDVTLRQQYKSAMHVMFDGYIAKCSIDYPIELKCEDLAHVLKSVSCPNIGVGTVVTVNTLFGENGKYQLLKGTGLKLYPKTAASDIQLHGVTVNKNLTAADVLNRWSKSKVYSYIKYDNDGNPCLAIGRSYFTNPKSDDINVDLDNKNTAPENIDFSYNVAENNLTLMETDKTYLAVEGTAMCEEENEDGDKKEKFIKMTVRKNPSYDPSDKNSSKWDILNESKVSKKQQELGARALNEASEKIELNTYTVMPYVSPNILRGTNAHDKLFQEIIKYFEDCNMNGIEGSLTLFGDLALKTGTLVHLQDDMYPQKNGVYMVDEVVTIFSAQHGYRQKIKLPYCVSRDKDKK